MRVVVERAILRLISLPGAPRGGGDGVRVHGAADQSRLGTVVSHDEHIDSYT